VSDEELVEGYIQGRIPRRAFVRLLIGGGLSLSAAVAYSNALAGGAAAAAAAPRADPHAPHHHRPVITYWVNGASQTTKDHRLAVRVILRRAGFGPPAHYILHRDSPPRDFTDLDHLVRLRDGETFTVRHR
jgi:hypothetical protein